MHELYELKEKLIEELEEYSKKGKFSREDVETIKYMSSAIDHLCNIMTDMDDGYSSRMSRDVTRGRMSYARGRGRNVRRDARGRYSSADGIEDFMWNLGEMMGSFPEEAKKDAERLMTKLEEMR